MFLFFPLLQRKDGPSKHEKELDKLRSKIEEMEKANLDPKVWTMRGEVNLSNKLSWYYLVHVLLDKNKIMYAKIFNNR